MRISSIEVLLKAKHPGSRRLSKAMNPYVSHELATVNRRPVAAGITFGFEVTYSVE